MTPRFLQIHTLTGFAATLLNRDDVGRAKRLPFGGCDRIRVSSQCLKRHWREATGEWSLRDIETGKSMRSRRVFSDVIAPKLLGRGLSADQVVQVLGPIRSAVLGESIKARDVRKAKKSGSDAEAALEDLRTEQVIVLGEPEIAFLTNLALDVSREDSEKTAAAVTAYFKDREKRKNLASLRIGAGLDAALFGRMVTSDIMARCDAAVHVAHAFTVHEEEAEADYFSALDDLTAAEGELGSGHINTSELTSGLFYSYVVVDLSQLVGNLSGSHESASEVLRRLLGLIATVSPGAKRGATAPYGCAELVVVEAGERQPRTLGNAFMDPVPRKGAKRKASKALGSYLGRFDAMYGVHEERRLSTMIEPAPENAGAALSLDALANWAGQQVQETS